MKYPKVWEGQGAPTIARVMGEARVRGLQMVDAPFLQASGPGFTARTQNGFASIETYGEDDKEGYAPYLFVPYSYTTEEGSWIRFGASNPEARQSWVFKIKGSGTDWALPNDVGQTSFAHVGGGFVVGMASNYGTTGTPEDHFVWPMLLRVARRSSAVVEDTAVLEAKQRSHVYFTSIATPLSSTAEYPTSVNMALALGHISVAASGYDITAGGYSFAYKSFAAELANEFFSPDLTESVKTYALEPVFYAANTSTLAPTQYAVPYFAGRVNHPAPVHCIGPGKLAYMLLAADYWPTAVTWSGSPGSYQVDSVTIPARSVPYVAISTDHGQTWDTEALPELDALIVNAKEPGGDSPINAGRYYRDNAHELSIASESTFIGVGEGVTLLICPKCVNDAAAALPPYPPQERAALFRRSADGTWSRLSWPPDAWTDDYVFFNPEFAAAIRSFGVGCAMLLVAHDGVAKILYTRDFGDTWALSETPADIGYLPTVIEPYVDDTKPGRILLMRPVTTGKIGIHAYETDGRFETFEDKGRFVKTTGILPETGYFGVYTGEYWLPATQYPPHVNPAFPTEFDRP